MSTRFRPGTAEMLRDGLMAVIEEGEGEPSAIALGFIAKELEDDRRHGLIDEEDYWLIRITLGLRKGAYTQDATGVIKKVNRLLNP